MNEQPVAPMPTPELPKEDDSLEAMETGSLFKTEKKVEIDDSAHYKLDTKNYLKQVLIILILATAFLLLAALLLYKGEVDQAATLFQL